VRSGTHNEVDVEEEADVEEEVGGAGHDQSPHVHRTCRVQSVDDEQRDSGMPHAHSTQYRHRRQNVLVLATNTRYRTALKQLL